MLLDSTTRLPEKPRSPKAVVAARKAEIAHRYHTRSAPSRSERGCSRRRPASRIEALIKHECGQPARYRQPRADCLKHFGSPTSPRATRPPTWTHSPYRLHVKLPPKLIEHSSRTWNASRGDIVRHPGQVPKVFANETREFLAITTIAPCDITPEKRRSLKRAAERERNG